MGKIPKLPGQDFLVFGGTQFMGRATVKALLDAGHRVTMISRGRTENPFEGHPNLVHHKVDRMTQRKGFKHALSNLGGEDFIWDAVIDFIGLHKIFINDTVEALAVRSANGRISGFRVRHYINIGSDTVYWNFKLPNGTDPIEEDSGEFFEDDAEFERHKNYCAKTATGEFQAQYGGQKLWVEVALQLAFEEYGFPYTTLRLPHVYGPFDNQGVFWSLVDIIQKQHPFPLRIPLERRRAGRSRSSNEDYLNQMHGYVESLRHMGELADIRRREDIPLPPNAEIGEHRFSWVFVEDVRDAILAVLAVGKPLFGEQLNIAHEEAVSLRDLSEMIATESGLEPEYVLLDEQNESEVPTTDFGALSVAKALRMLAPYWKPTPMKEAIGKALKWYAASEDNLQYHQKMHNAQRMAALQYAKGGAERQRAGVQSGSIAFEVDFTAPGSLYENEHPDKIAERDSDYITEEDPNSEWYDPTLLEAVRLKDNPLIDGFGPLRYPVIHSNIQAPLTTLFPDIPLRWDTSTSTTEHPQVLVA